MKKIRIFSTSFLVPFLTLGILRLTGCFDKESPEIIDDCVILADCTTENPSLEDPSNKYFTAFGTEPFWNIEISGGIAKLSSPMYDTNVEVPVNIWQEGENYYFSGEELEGEFIKKDCIDGGKGDLHNYTVGVAKFREYYYEGCGDDEEGIKMSDEDVPENWYQYQDNNEELKIIQIVEDRIANGFSDMETCMHTLNQYQPERMPGDPQTQITVGCGAERYGEVYLTGYIYTSVYPDLGLRITTPAGYDTFYVKSESPIFIREGNRISYGAEFIEVFEKSENESLENIIKKQLKNGCSINKEIISYEDQTKITSSNPKTQIYSILDNGDPYVSNNCFDDILDDTRPIIWFFESPDKTKYYKLGFTDGCAPGPCSMFGEVELF